MPKIEFIPVKTGKFIPPKHDIYAEMDKYLPELHENDVVFITSKVLAIHQGRTILKSEIKSKDELIKQEADFFVERDLSQEHNILVTIKNNVIIASAGIDESNSNGYYTLWPKNIDAQLKEIRSYLCKKYSLTNLGVVATDSHTTPLRRGVSGIALGISGVQALSSQIGKPDIFGNPLKITYVDQIAPLTSMAVWYMGESGEQTPICIARGEFDLEFDAEASTNDFFISPEEDIFRPLLKNFYK